MVADTIEVATALNVHGDTTLFGDLTVEGDVAITGTLKLSSRQAGLATIPAGAEQVSVSYPEAFATVPLVQLTPLRGATSQGPLPSYWLSNLTAEGFSIIVEQSSVETMHFTWQATPTEEDLEFATLEASTEPAQPDPGITSEAEGATTEQTTDETATSVDVAGTQAVTATLELLGSTDQNSLVVDLEPTTSVDGTGAEEADLPGLEILSLGN